MKKIRIISLIILVISIFVSSDLLINLIGSLVPEMNDGIGTHSIYRDRSILVTADERTKDFSMHL